MPAQQSWKTIFVAFHLSFVFYMRTPKSYHYNEYLHINFASSLVAQW